jgi:glucosamine--fructose-6-phosphate aminotransferase (isomerizing)
MYVEAAQAPDAVREQLHTNAARIARLAQRLRHSPPRAIVTCARGSSDHAATFARYLIETRLGVLTSSAAPSVSSVYESAPDLSGSVVLAISQSGASPDLLAAVSRARSAGARIVAMVNAETSPLAQLADDLIPLRAGAERSVAATKSWIASLAAIVQLVAEWAQDAVLAAQLQQAPEQLERAWQLDWSAAVALLAPLSNLYVIGRGPGLGIAQEAALKLKETCGLHAEALSAAELRHGPMALVRAGFPLLLFSQNDETRAGMETLIAELVAQGAALLVAGMPAPHTQVLPTVGAHPVIEPMLFAQSFYRMVNQLALARGRDPDRPPHLNKVTETI